MARDAWGTSSTRLWLTLLQAAAVCLALAGGSVRAELALPPLVNADEELAGFLKEARQMVAQGRYPQAIEILQALIQRPDGGFVASKDSRRYTALAREATAAIGAMDAKGRTLYQALYGPQAARLYEEASEAGDTEALRRIVDRYAWTDHGPKALGMLASMHFDRGRFGQAARCWQQLLQRNSSGASEAILLAQMAAAHHFSDQARPAAQAVEQLAQKHPKAQALLGGKQQNVLAFARRVLAMPVPQGRVHVSEQSWPGLGGVPDGMAVMSDCDVVLSPHWRYPAAPSSLSKVDAGDLLALRFHLGATSNPASRSSSRKISTRLQGGQVVVKYQYGNQQFETVAPPVIQPVVLGNVVIFRTDERVIACDLFGGGKALWEVRAPMHVNLVSGPRTTVRLSYYYPGLVFEDGGQYALTAADGKIFLLGDFLPPNVRFYSTFGRPGPKPPHDGSSLIALSLKDKGAVAWKIPAADEADELLRGGKFVSPPTYSNGRLFIVNRYLDSYYLVCLDAATAGVNWKVLVSQSPVTPRDPRMRQMSLYGQHASLPAVADGRVYVLTNAGTIAAFDVDNGQALWAYQYDSSLNLPVNTAVGGVIRSQYGRPMQVLPRNPLIVSGGRVVCLPADGAKVLAFDAADGTLVWATPRSGQRNLSGIDEKRVLVSSPELQVLSSTSGKLLARASDAPNILGRPVVSPRAVLAAGKGRLYRMDLQDYKVHARPLADADGLLGNLVSVEGKLIAANVAGLCAYLDYEFVHKRLTDSMASADQVKRLELLLQRLRLSFNARRYSEALADVETARKLAEAAGDTYATDRLNRLAYQTHVAAGNISDDPEKMLASFERAKEMAELTEEPQDDAHLLLRLAKCYDRLGDLEKAAQLAQKLSEDYQSEDLVDVEIGPDADLTGRFSPDRRRYAGYDLGQKLIQALVEIHGQDVYAHFDEQAFATLDAARKADVPKEMADVAERWPHSRWSDDARLAAAEAWYRRSRSAETLSARADHTLAVEQLLTLAHTESSELHRVACAVLAVLYSRDGLRNMPRSYANRARVLPEETPIKFGDIEGTLAKVLQEIEAKTGPPANAQPQGRIELPLKVIFSVADGDAMILRDQDSRPVVLDGDLFLIRKKEVSRVSPAADDLAKATRWKGTGLVDSASIPNFSYPSGAFRIVSGLSMDRKVLAVVGAAGLTGYDVAWGKTLWQKTVTEYGLVNFWCAGVRNGSIVVADRNGALACIDAATGKLRWRAKVVGQGASFINPPEISEQSVLIRHHRGRHVTCLDMATGKIVGRWKGTAAQGTMTPEGLVVVLIDGKLAVYDPGALDKPLWTAALDAAKRPVILAASPEAIVVSRGIRDPDITVYSVTENGRVIATLSPEKSGAFVPLPSHVEVRGDRFYVQYSLMYIGTGLNVLCRTAYARGLSLQCFDFTGKRRWANHTQRTPSDQYACQALVAGGKHLVLTARQVNFTRPSSVLVLSREDGKTLETLDMRGKLNDPKKSMKRMFMLGRPVMTPGRLIMETGQGVTVYGK